MLVYQLVALSLLCLLSSAEEDGSGLKTEVLHKPDDCETKSKDKDMLTMHYTGTLEDGKKFDSRWEVSIFCFVHLFLLVTLCSGILSCYLPKKGNYSLLNQKRTCWQWTPEKRQRKAQPNYRNLVEFNNTGHFNGVFLKRLKHGFSQLRARLTLCDTVFLLTLTWNRNSDECQIKANQEVIGQTDTKNYISIRNYICIRKLYYFAFLEALFCLPGVGAVIVCQGYRRSSVSQLVRPPAPTLLNPLEKVWRRKGSSAYKFSRCRALYRPSVDGSGERSRIDVEAKFLFAVLLVQFSEPLNLRLTTSLTLSIVCVSLNLYCIV